MLSLEKPESQNEFTTELTVKPTKSQIIHVEDLISGINSNLKEQGIKENRKNI